MNSRQIAEAATIQSFLNCYLRETGNFKSLAADDPLTLQLKERTNAKSAIICPLAQQNIEILVGVKYWSLSDRHIFTFPLFYKCAARDQLLELDYLTLSTLLLKELSLSMGSTEPYDELIERVIQSCNNIQQFVEARQPKASELYEFKRNFGETEQSLVLGHHLHPTPKSRQGFLSQEMTDYSPETEGEFSLHYFRAHKSIIIEGSTLEESATELIKTELRNDDAVSEAFKATYCGNDDYALVPVHPWQGRWLLHSEKVQNLIGKELLEDLGQQGRKFKPTSSVRTVYNADARFMVKLSLNIKITNSVRANLFKELERGLEVNQIFSSTIGKDLRFHFPNFEVIRDPAYITIPLDGKESGFATILRANPFQTKAKQIDNLNTDSESDASCLIGLCQDALDGSGSRLANIIRTLATQENRSTEKVSIDWFKQYLSLSVKPMLWMYFTYGIALEAHQQNSVLELKDGYPKCFHYRDNQGYYYRESFSDKLNGILEGISQKSETFCPDEVIDECLVYYVFINNVFGIINALGVAELVDENLLLRELNILLAEFADFNLAGSKLLDNLQSETFRTKANLLTRFNNMDELVGSVATQSVYVNIQNPLHTVKTMAKEEAYA
ncbi:IucA/IucC family protein [[Leptolyngbya] sp. PCC 7376]|uniref:IucA/IucC family protein n=1 Tax=[Leptolyngbya] sp. PCC 7376 TaxID=111781 RepID=K9Q581_9CHRO|nr:IucA/IucC family protein [[Leptolyngbya] sp. PCC 7376]AFY40274.1 IucA/IucC family protein [[Leptolyngbya] sp. PCC 7376]